MLGQLLGKEAEAVRAEAVTPGETARDDLDKDDDVGIDLLAEFARLRVYLEGIKGGPTRTINSPPGLTGTLHFRPHILGPTCAAPSFSSCYSIGGHFGTHYWCRAFVRRTFPAPSSAPTASQFAPCRVAPNKRGHSLQIRSHRCRFG